MTNSHIVLFDGACNFCNGAVSFIINRDPQAKFVFAPVQSEVAMKLMREHQVNNDSIDTLLLIKNGQCYLRSNAALEIARDLSGYWYLLSVLRIIPRPIRDFFYSLLARNRYKLFGRQSKCLMPSDDIKNRFVGV